MNDLISRKELLDEILLIEKELLRDKEDARNSDDEQMLFAIDNQMNALWRARCKINNQHIAYDVDNVVAELKSHSNNEKMATSKLFNGKHRYYRAISVTKAVRIVKRGGIDE